MSAHERAVEAREMIHKLSASSFGPLVNIMASEPDCFTNGGRINCAAAARHLGVPANDVRNMVQQLRGMTGP